MCELLRCPLQEYKHKGAKAQSHKGPKRMSVSDFVHLWLNSPQATPGSSVLIKECSSRWGCLARYCEGSMKRVLSLLLIILGLVSETAAADQSASKIIDRYKKASGGSAVSRVKSTLMSGSFKTADGSVGRFTC